MTDKITNSFPTFQKTDSTSALKLEACGLNWLGEAMHSGGAHTVRVMNLTPNHIETTRVDSHRITRSAAYNFGAALAKTHAAGATHFGQAPTGWDPKNEGNMGKAPLQFVTDESLSWGEFYAQYRLMPYVPAIRSSAVMSSEDTAVIERLCESLRDGDFDSSQPALVTTPASRIHGDLWSGNVMWAKTSTLNWAPAQAGSAGSSDDGISGVLIDPAAQGGHAETDLAYLSVFGQSYLDDIYAGYNATSALASGWEDRVGLHQLHILIVHAYLFGGGYGRKTAHIARRYI